MLEKYSRRCRKYRGCRKYNLQRVQWCRREKRTGGTEGAESVGSGAGDGDRTRDVQLGKLAFYR